MITFFSNPRPFKGPFNTWQRNAILSWKSVCPGCQIILFEDEEGTTSKAALELGVEFVEGRETSEFGTPRLDSSFNLAKQHSKFDIIVQISSDIILTDDFLTSVKKVLKVMQGRPFFMAGRRTNLNFQDKIDFLDENWQKKILNLVKKEGELFRFSAMDYWVMTKNYPFEFPPFVIGRIGTDSWLVYKLRSLDIPVIDATLQIMVIHQNHHYPRKKEESFFIEEKKNIALAGGLFNLMTLREADRVLDEQGIIRPGFPRRIFSDLALFYPWRLIIFIKRKLGRLR